VGGPSPAACARRSRQNCRFPSGSVGKGEGKGGSFGAAVVTANGEGAKLRGQGPRPDGRAARRVPAFEARDAGGVTPSKYRCSRRLGRRTEAGPRRLLRRVRRRPLARKRRFGSDDRRLRSKVRQSLYSSGRLRYHGVVSKCSTTRVRLGDIATARLPELLAIGLLRFLECDHGLVAIC